MRICADADPCGSGSETLIFFYFIFSLVVRAGTYGNLQAKNHFYETTEEKFAEQKKNVLVGTSNQSCKH